MCWITMNFLHNALQFRCSFWLSGKRMYQHVRQLQYSSFIVSQHFICHIFHSNQLQMCLLKLIAAVIFAFPFILVIWFEETAYETLSGIHYCIQLTNHHLYYDIWHPRGMHHVIIVPPALSHQYMDTCIYAVTSLNVTTCLRSCTRVGPC